MILKGEKAWVLSGFSNPDRHPLNRMLSCPRDPTVPILGLGPLLPPASLSEPWNICNYFQRRTLALEIRDMFLLPSGPVCVSRGVVSRAVSVELSGQHPVVAGPIDIERPAVGRHAKTHAPLLLGPPPALHHPGIDEASHAVHLPIPANEHRPSTRDLDFNGFESAFHG